MNTIIICGRLGHDPELREYKSKGETKKMAKFTVAVNRYDGDGTDWFSVVAFSNAEAIEKWKKKGDEILVKGRMECSKYTDKNGNNRDFWQIVADRDGVRFIGKKNDQAQPNEPTPKFEETEEEIPF